MQVLTEKNFFCLTGKILIHPSNNALVEWKKVDDDLNVCFLNLEVASEKIKIKKLS